MFLINLNQIHAKINLGKRTLVKGFVSFVHMWRVGKGSKGGQGGRV